MNRESWKMDQWRQLTYDCFAKCKFRLQSKDEWTVLASVIQITDKQAKVVALGCGLKALSEELLSPSSSSSSSTSSTSSSSTSTLKQQLVRDCHGEVLARRAFIRYLLDQWRLALKEHESIIAIDKDTGSISIKKSVSFAFFSSHIPCGEASMDAHQLDAPSENNQRDVAISAHVVRGREFSYQLNQLRTKPGRADAQISMSMSCSDKLALWSCIGWTGNYLPFDVPLIIPDLAVACEDMEMDRIGVDRMAKKIASTSPAQVHCIPKGKSTNPLDYRADAKPTPLSHVWWLCSEDASIEPGRNQEILVDGRKFGSKKPSRDHQLNPKSMSALCSQSLRQCSSSLLHSSGDPFLVNASAFDQSDANNANQLYQYQMNKSAITNDPKSAFFGWYTRRSSFKNRIDFFTNPLIKEEVEDDHDSILSLAKKVKLYRNPS